MIFGIGQFYGNMSNKAEVNTLRTKTDVGNT
jgi:hypothetical protein